MEKTALITGITGQDGSYLAEFLLSKGYTVHGIIRRSSSFNTTKIDHIFNKLFLHYGDVTDAGSVTNIIYNTMPDEIYNLAAQSHVMVSFGMPVYTTNTIIDGTLNILEAVKNLRSKKTIKVYQASSSEMFGSSRPPQYEDTPFAPRSPYGASKLASHWNAINYREGYDLFICCGILFNHESPRRTPTFVTRKITKAISNIIKGKQRSITLGNLYSFRDFGFSPDYVEAMWKMMQLGTPMDFVIGTGVSHTIFEFLKYCFHYAGLSYIDYVKTEDIYKRPTEVDYLKASPTKAEEILMWKHNVCFNNLCEIMVDYDLMQEGMEPIGDGIDFILNEKAKGNYLWTTIGEGR